MTFTAPLSTRSPKHGTNEPGLFIWQLHELIGLQLIDTGQFSQRLQGAQRYRIIGRQVNPHHCTPPVHSTTAFHTLRAFGARFRGLMLVPVDSCFLFDEIRYRIDGYRRR